jgi:hypothetical protein
VHAFSRLDHLMLHVDEPKALETVLTALEMPVVMPSTPFAFDDDSGVEIEFEAKLWGLGSGFGLFPYQDKSVAEARAGHWPSACIGSLAMEPSRASRFTTQALLPRAEVMHIPEPISYHIPEHQRRKDPSLPPWMFRRVLFPHAGINGDAGLMAAGQGGAIFGGQALDGLVLSASSASVPPYPPSFAVTWHRDLQHAGLRARKSDLQSLPAGVLGVVACTRVLVSAAESDGDETVLATAGFWDRLGHSVVQTGRGELVVQFPYGGPSLCISAVSDAKTKPKPSSKQAAAEAMEESSSALAKSGRPGGRVYGWEWAVMADRARAGELLRAAGLPIISGSEGKAGWRLVADLGPAGMHGCALHVIPASASHQLQVTHAYQTLKRLVGSGDGTALTAASALIDAEGDHKWLLPHWRPSDSSA